jgi:hypothetical protein
VYKILHEIVSHYSRTISFPALCVNFGNWEGQLSHSSQGSYFQNACSYEGRSLLGRPKRSLIDSAEMSVKETGWENWTEFMWFGKTLFRSPVILRCVIPVVFIDTNRMRYLCSLKSQLYLDMVHEVLY